VSGLVGFYLGMAMVIFAIWFNYFAARSNMVRPNGPTLIPHTMTLDDAGISGASALAKADYVWSMFTDVSEREDVILLWYEPAAGIVIPKEAFASLQAQAEFIDAARARIGSSTR
jgi:hypothetical protein